MTPADRAIAALGNPDPWKLPAVALDVRLGNGSGPERPFVLLTADGTVPGYKPRPKRRSEINVGDTVLAHTRGRVRECIVWKVGRTRVSLIYNTPTDAALARKSHRKPYPLTVSVPITALLGGGRA